MKILILTTNFPKFIEDYYGSFIFDNLRELIKQNQEVKVICPHWPGINYKDNFEGIEISRFKWWEPKSFKPFMYFSKWGIFRILTMITACFYYTYKYLRKNEVNLIDSQNILPMGFIAVILGKIFKKPTIATAHGEDLRAFYAHSFWVYFVKYTLKRLSRIIVVSEELLNYCQKLGISEKKIILLPNGVDTVLFAPQSSEAKRENFKIGFLGEFNAYTSPEILIESIPPIKDQIKNLEILLAGDGPLRLKFEKRAEELNIEDFTHFLGELKHEDVPAFFQGNDLIVNTCPITSIMMLEAMACGKTIIATNIECQDSPIQDGTTGIIVKNNPEELAKSIIYLYEDEESRKQISSQAREFIVKNHSLKNRVNRILEIYNQAIEEMT